MFAPHHGRDSGKIPVSILEQMDPKIVVIGEAPSKEPELLSGLQHNNPEFCRLYLLRMRRQLGPHLCWKLNLQRRLSRGQRSLVPGCTSGL